MTARDIRIVLVRPKEDKNIGSVCRAMKTMGFGSLTIVGHDSVNPAEAAITAVHAADVLERAIHCETLEEAVRDAVLVAGVSRRRGKWRKYFAVSPEQLVDRVVSIRRGTCAVVFGNEASGLDADELARCHLAVRIPSSPEFPSLNLSHAVQIITYQLFCRLDGKRQSGRKCAGRCLLRQNFFFGLHGKGGAYRAAAIDTAAGIGIPIVPGATSRNETRPDGHHFNGSRATRHVFKNEPKPGFHSSETTNRN